MPDFDMIKVSEIVLHPVLLPRDGTELMVDIKAQGIFVPLVGRKTATEGQIEVCDGSRRWDAAKRLKLEKVPVYVRTMSDQEALITALSANLNRKDLTPTQEANIMNALRNEGLSNKEIGARCGRDESTVTDRLKLLRLDPDVQKRVDAGLLPVQIAERALPILDAYPDAQKKLVDEYRRERFNIITVDDAVRMAKGTLRDIKQLEAFKESMAKAEHKICPLCKRAANRLSYTREPPWVSCELSHEWNAETGRLAKEYRPIEEAKPGQKPRRPELPSRILKLEYTAAEVREALVTWALKHDHFYKIEGPGFAIDTGEGEPGYEGPMHVETYPTRGRTTGDRSEAKIEAHKYDTGEKTRVEVLTYGRRPEEISADVKKIADLLDEVMKARSRKRAK